jgi:hypothetical protein
VAIEVTVQITGTVTIVVDTDATYSPDVAEDLLRRCRESAVAAYLELPDDIESTVDDES